MTDFTSEFRANPASHILAFCIGSVGAVGQAWILYHILIDHYPFKMMAMPPASFYVRIGEIGTIISPVLAIIIAWFCRNIRLYVVPIIPVLICPVIFWLTFEIAVFATYTTELLQQVNFEHYTGESARYYFGYNVLTLMFYGALIGSLIGLVLQAVTKLSIRKRP